MYQYEREDLEIHSVALPKTQLCRVAQFSYLGYISSILLSSQVRRKHIVLGHFENWRYNFCHVQIVTLRTNLPIFVLEIFKFFMWREVLQESGTELIFTWNPRGVSQVKFWRVRSRATVINLAGRRRFMQFEGIFNQEFYLLQSHLGKSQSRKINKLLIISIITLSFE